MNVAIDADSGKLPIDKQEFCAKLANYYVNLTKMQELPRFSFAKIALLIVNFNRKH